MSIQDFLKKIFSQEQKMGDSKLLEYFLNEHEAEITYISLDEFKQVEKDKKMIMKEAWDKLPQNAQEVLSENGFHVKEMIQKDLWDRLPKNVQQVLRNNGFDVEE